MVHRDIRRKLFQPRISLPLNPSFSLSVRRGPVGQKPAAPLALVASWSQEGPPTQPILSEVSANWAIDAEGNATEGCPVVGRGWGSVRCVLDQCIVDTIRCEVIRDLDGPWPGPCTLPPLISYGTWSVLLPQQPESPFFTVFPADCDRTLRHRYLFPLPLSFPRSINLFSRCSTEGNSTEAVVTNHTDQKFVTEACNTFSRDWHSKSSRSKFIFEKLESKSLRNVEQRRNGFTRDDWRGWWLRFLDRNFSGIGSSMFVW